MGWKEGPDRQAGELGWSGREDRLCNILFVIGHSTREMYVWINGHSDREGGGVGPEDPEWGRVVVLEGCGCVCIFFPEEWSPGISALLWWSGDSADKSATGG